LVNIGENDDMGIPDMTVPEPVPQPQLHNSAESLFGGMMSGIQNVASRIGNNFQNASNQVFGGGIEGMGGMGSMEGMGGNNNPHYDVDMPANNDSNLTDSQLFLARFRDKNGDSIELPNFVNNPLIEVARESQKLRRPVFLYVHNHKGDSCSVVDQAILNSDVMLDSLKKLI